MAFLQQAVVTIQNIDWPPLLAVGLVMFAAFYAGRGVRFLRLPSIIGFMLAGVIAGPSLFNMISDSFQDNLSFITQIALGVVALSIGLELNLNSLRQFGKGIIIIILFESLLAFLVVFGGVFALTRNLPLSLLFGAIAPASAPAGTVAIIHEYKARGSLTKALYAVVGFDDGVGIIIFGFAAAIARALLQVDPGGETAGFAEMVFTPLFEVGLSLVIGVIAALIYCPLARKLNEARDVLILAFAVVLIISGLSAITHTSLILTNMIAGLVVVNTQPPSFTQRLRHELEAIMPLLFVLFFAFAGANLHLSALPSLGLLGVVYAICRTVGLILGARVGGRVGKLEPKIQKYLGMGILSQAGVAIGLALIIKHEFSSLGTAGSEIGTQIITTVTATCIFFEILGPICTRIALEKAGETNVE